MSSNVPNDEFVLYVPSGGRDLGIAPGSAIVGGPLAMSDDKGAAMIDVHYEGAVHGQKMNFEEKLQHAAGRRSQDAPVIACGLFQNADLIPVGRVHRSERLRGWIVSHIDKPAELRAWSGEDVPVGGSLDLRGRAAGIAYGRMTPSARINVDMRITAGEDPIETILGRE